MRERKKHLADWGEGVQGRRHHSREQQVLRVLELRAHDRHDCLKRDFGIPVCSIEKEYINSASGQLRTRFQAFVESIEIKQIQEGK